MFKLGKRNVQLYKPSIQDMVILGNLCVNIILTRNARNPRNGCAQACSCRRLAECSHPDGKRERSDA